MTPTWRDLIRVFGRIGLLSFGGPAAQIALMHKELVADRPWLTEAQFLRALSFCMLLPGPEAMQLATYAGWRQRGVAGGLIAGGLFVVPGAIVILALALLYGAYGQLPLVQALFMGVQAAVVVIVVTALRKVLARAVTGTLPLVIAAFAFVALFAFAVPFPLVIAVAAAVGALVLPGKAEPADSVPQHQASSSMRVVLLGAALWSAPLVMAWLMGAAFLTDLGLFFSKLAVVSFGGAYAVLAYMTQTVVQDYGWITTAQMIDALGLAETTPGPLILVTEFVGLLAGLRQGGVPVALLAGAMTLWVTFVPCFIWIFAGAPLIDRLATQPRLQGALAGITAAVVGVIGNLSLWFALHVFFADLDTRTFAGVTLSVPDWGSFLWQPAALAAIAGYLMVRRNVGLVMTLLVAAVLGMLLFLAGWA